MKSEQLFPLLEFEDGVGTFAQRGHPSPCFGSDQKGRMSAWRNGNGGVRGIVVGDVLRRLVARTIAQQIGVSVERAI